MSRFVATFIQKPTKPTWFGLVLSSHYVDAANAPPDTGFAMSHLGFPSDSRLFNVCACLRGGAGRGKNFLTHQSEVAPTQISSVNRQASRR